MKCLSKSLNYDYNWSTYISPILIKIVWLYSQISYSPSNICGTLTRLPGSNRIHKDHICHPIFVVTWLICQDPIKILCKSYPDSSARIQWKYFLSCILSRTSRFNTYIVLHIDSILSLKKLRRMELDYSNFSRPYCKSPFI